MAAALIDSGEAILRARTEDEVLAGLCRIVVGNLGLPLVWVGLVEPGTRRLLVSSAQGAKAGVLADAGFSKDGLVTSGNIVSRALRTGQPQTVSDLAAEPVDSSGWALAQGTGFRSAASFPIRSGHTVIGALQCVSDEVGYFSDEIVGLLVRLSASASTMVAFLEHERRRHEVERDLTAGRQKEHGLFDLAPVAIMVLWLDRVEVNDALLDMFGYPDQESLDAAGPLAIVDPADREACQKLAAFLGPGHAGPRTLQTTGRRADGSAFPMLLERVALDEIDASSGVIFLTDLTSFQNAESSSRHSKARLKAILDNVPVGLLSLNLDGIIKSWNPAAAQMFRRTEAEAVGHPAPGGPVEIKNIRRMACGELPQLRGELVGHVRADHTSVDLRISTSTLKGAAGEPSGLLVVAEDVTDRNRIDAEHALLATAIDQSSDSIVITDPAATIQYVNPAFERVTGYSRAEAVGQNPRFLQSGVQAPSYYAAMGAILARGETWRGTFINRARDGRLFEEDAAISPVFDSSGRLVNYVAVKRDVTREREAEQALRLSEERFRNLADFANDAIFIRELDGRFLDANRTACERLGYSRDQLLNMSVADIDPHLAAGELADRTETILREGSAVFETAQLTRAGKVIPTELSSTVIDYSGRKAILSIARDITDRKRIDEALHKSEMRFRTLIEVAPTAIILSRDGIGLYANRTFLEMFGLRSAQETVGKPVFDYFAPEQRDTSKERARGRSLGLTVADVYDSIGLRADGSKFPIHAEIKAIELPDGKANVAFITDTSDREASIAARETAEAGRLQALAALQQSESKFSTAFRTSPDSVTITRLSDGVFIDASESFTAVFGYTAEEIAGKTTVDLGLWADPSTRERMTDALSADGFIRNMDVSFRCKDGSIVRGLTSASLIDLDGEACLLAVMRDITDRLLAEDRFRTLFESTNDAIYICDEEGRFLEVNRTACERLGYSRDELLGMTVAEIGTPEFAATLPARSRSILEHGSGFFETVHLRRDGTTVPVEINASVIDQGGRKVILAIARDISERKLAESQRAILEEQLHRAAKEEDIGRLAGGIAHDFNNLLTAIRGSASLALAELPPGEGPREDLEQIEQAADRAAGLTRQLLAFARRTVLEPRVVDLVEIVRRVKPMLERLIGEDIKLATETSDQGSWIMADPGKIEQVIVNLVVNARDAMPHGGAVTIATNRSPESPGSVPLITLSVADTGVGMSAETLSHLFEPFFTTKGPGEGTGLGLATVSGIVRQSGGSVSVTSELGRGSTFTISLPAVEPPTGRSRPSPSETVPREAGSGTVLVVEDDAGVRRFVSRVLKQAGYRVLEARSGADAVRIGQTEAIKLLLTDVVMPEMSGTEVASRLPGVRVMFMSGHTEKGIVRDGVLEPDVRLLAKPFTSDRLLSAVHAAITGTDGLG